MNAKDLVSEVRRHSATVIQAWLYRAEAMKSHDPKAAQLCQNIADAVLALTVYLRGRVEE